MQLLSELISRTVEVPNVVQNVCTYTRTREAVRVLIILDLSGNLAFKSHTYGSWKRYTTFSRFLKRNHVRAMACHFDFRYRSRLFSRIDEPFCRNSLYLISLIFYWKTMMVSSKISLESLHWLSSSISRPADVHRSLHQIVQEPWGVSDCQWLSAFQ